jgi:hypothetical protein
MRHKNKAKKLSANFFQFIKISYLYTIFFLNHKPSIYSPKKNLFCFNERLIFLKLEYILIQKGIHIKLL